MTSVVQVQPQQSVDCVVGLVDGHRKNSSNAADRRRSSFAVGGAANGARKGSAANGHGCLGGGGGSGGSGGHHQDQSQLAMAAAAAEGIKLGEKMGISCPEFGRSMTPPRIEQPKKRTSIFAHLILSLVAAAMSLTVGFWFLFISRDRRRSARVIGTCIAFVCAVLFLFLGYIAVRRRRQKTEPEIEIDPVALREQRRSMSNSLRKQTLPLTGDELMNQIRRHSTCITMESCERALHGPGSVKAHAAAVLRVAPTKEVSAHLAVGQQQDQQPLITMVTETETVRDVPGKKSSA